MPKRSLTSEDSDEEPSSEPGDDSPNTKRVKYVEFEPVRLCSIGSVKEIDSRVLRAQYYKLCERLRYKQKIQQDFEKRIEGFERRQVQDDAVNCTINRYWNRLDEEVQLLLQRFDGHQIYADKGSEESTSQQNRHFLTVLSQWTCEELDEKLAQRVECSQRDIAKLVQICTQINEQNGRICSFLRDAGVNELNKNKANSENSPPGEDGRPVEEEVNHYRIDEELRNYAISVFEENSRLQKMFSEMQMENHQLKIKTASHDDNVTMLKSRVESLTSEIEDFHYRLDTSIRKEVKLEHRLAEYVRKENALHVSTTTQKSAGKSDTQSNGIVEGEELASLSKAKLDEIQRDLEIQTELANNRLLELQEMTERNKSLSAELEESRMKIKYISSDDVKNSTEYRCLNTSFQSLFEDCKLQRKEIDELKQQLIQIKQTHEEQMNSLKTDESAALDRFKQMVIALDNDLNTARREYENVCVEYEVNTVSREQAAPIQDQINSLMNTLTIQNNQLKLEVARMKRKWQEAIAQLQICQKELDGERLLNNDNYLIIKLAEDSSAFPAANSILCDQNISGRDTPLSNNSSASPHIDGTFLEIKKEEKMEADSQNGQDIKLCKATNNSINNAASSPPPLAAPADQADESQTVVQQLKIERDRFKEKLRSLARTDLKEKRKQWNEEQKRRVKQLEEQCERLRKDLHSAKAEEDGLMQEMESIGQAFDELKDQNQKLLEQLREKEDVNLKLMSEKIKNTQAQKKMRDEKELLDQTVQSLENQLAAKLLLCKKLEDKEHSLTELRATMEQELRIRDQTIEILKKKVAEHTQLSTDLRLRLDRMDSQFNELRENVVKKASTHEANANKIKRLEEERSALKRRLERAKRMEKFDNIDQVLQEENRLLRESMTCPSCKVNKKNAILDKCHHVFCLDCIRLRYDNRRRKCPKCNAAFGANDYHRIYLD